MIVNKEHSHLESSKDQAIHLCTLHVSETSNKQRPFTANKLIQALHHLEHSLERIAPLVQCSVWQWSVWCSSATVMVDEELEAAVVDDAKA